MGKRICCPHIISPQNLTWLPASVYRQNVFAELRLKLVVPRTPSWIRNDTEWRHDQLAKRFFDQPTWYLANPRGGAGDDDMKFFISLVNLNFRFFKNFKNPNRQIKNKNKNSIWWFDFKLKSDHQIEFGFTKIIHQTTNLKFENFDLVENLIFSPGEKYPNEYILAVCGRLVKTA